MSVDRGRRRTLGGLLAGLAAASPVGRAVACLGAPAPSPRSAPPRPVVAVARREGLLGPDARLDRVKLREALGGVVARAGDEDTPVEALRRLFRPNDVVGIKVNCLGGPGMSPRPEVAHQLAAWLQEAGVPASRIVIWDRTNRELRQAGYRVQSGSGVKVLGTDRDYEQGIREWGPAASRFARMFVEDMTALISLGVLKEHGLAGVTLGMKNWFGALNNPNKLHDDGCNPFVPHIVAHPLVRDKLRLTVVDGINGQCHGGPARSPRWVWPYQGFLASTDTVALDAVGWEVLEARRKEVGLRSLTEENREPRYIRQAAEMGLGVADPERIEVARL